MESQSVGCLRMGIVLLRPITRPVIVWPACLRGIRYRQDPWVETSSSSLMNGGPIPPSSGRNCFTLFVSRLFSARVHVKLQRIRANRRHRTFQNGTSLDPTFVTILSTHLPNTWGCPVSTYLTLSSHWKPKVA